MAPNSSLRAAATAYGRVTDDGQEPASNKALLPEADGDGDGDGPNLRSPARYRWAMLLARLFESLPLTWLLLPTLFRSEFLKIAYLATGVVWRTASPLNGRWKGP